MPVSRKTNGASKPKIQEPIIPDLTERAQVTPPQGAIPVGRFVLLVVIVSFIVGGISGAVFSSTDLFRSITNSINAQFAVQQSASNVNLKTLSVQEESATVDVVKNANESVVSIIVSKDLSKFYDTSSPFSPYFFDTNLPQGQQEIGGGTGFIISSDGIIVTNKHVVADQDAEYTVLLNNRESFAARVIATDPLNDVAFVKIESGDELPTLDLGDSDTLQIGQTVIAIGNALGEYRNTVTKGIVSGLSRTVIAGDNAGTQETLDDVIQTDAAINPGNSGGPLLNLEGQVVGVNTAISLEGQLIGFAIPVNQIKQAVESVQDVGRVVRPMLGVRYVTITEEIARQNELEQTYGALIVRGSSSTEPAVIPQSAADRAGLKEDDIILELNGEKIEGDVSLSKLIQKYSPGDQITIKYVRDGEEQTVTVKLDELPSS